MITGRGDRKTEVIAFDADDTLWHNETRFRQAEAFFKNLLGEHATEEQIDSVLYRHELKNIQSFGYGAKTFTLSMVEAAIELSERSVTAQEIEEIIRIGNEIINEPLVVFDDVKEVLEKLGKSYDLMIVTKGDLMEQENKIRRSELGHFFRHTEIVSEKTASTYLNILERHSIEPDEFLMVGNSLKSDILPVIAIGGTAIHIPYHTTWIHEEVSDEIAAASDHISLESLKDLISYSSDNLRPKKEPTRS
jgi:putative hydrolase of the HAD superfamily